MLHVGIGADLRNSGSAAYGVEVDAEQHKADVDDVHRLALMMRHVTVSRGPASNPVYQVGGKSFVFFRTPRPDALDSITGERLSDVIVFWVESESDKLALVQDPTSPFFTTPHFDGHPSVLLRAARLGRLTRRELSELIQDAWLCQASNRRRDAWLASRFQTEGARNDLP